MADQLLFDKLVYKDRLTRAGISDEQARAMTDAMHEALHESVATKSFVREELMALRLDLTIRMGAAVAAAVAILASIKFFA